MQISAVILFCFFLGAFSKVAFAHNYCVKTPGAKLRWKPDVRQKAVWRAMRFTPLLGSGKMRGAFLEVTNVDGTTFWIHKSDVTSRYSCLVVKVKRTTLRKGPGNNFGSAKTAFAEKHEAFRDLGGEDGWTLVQDEMGEVSWISLDQTWKPKSKIRLSFEE
jgi:hypothetical protein